jgi:hypothetical protein
MCTKECPNSYHHDLIVFTSYSKLMTKFSRRQEFKYYGLITEYDPKVLRHFMKTAERKIKKQNRFLIEEVEEIISYRSYIRAKQKPIPFTINYFAMPCLINNGSLIYNGCYS